MSVDDIMELLLFVVLVVLPLLGVTLRFALKPVVQAVIQLSEGLRRSGASRIGSDDPAALERMQEELSELHHKVAELEASDAFYRKLIDPQNPPDPSTPTS